jgi:hypothetical protein
MRRLSPSNIVRAIRVEKHPDSGLVRFQGRAVQPMELFIKVNTEMWFWVRESGAWVSGHAPGGYFGYRPGLIGRWRIRRAVRQWLTKSKPHLGACRMKNYGDSMTCECGMRYDTNDPAPPVCPRTNERLP